MQQYIAGQVAFYAIYHKDKLIGRINLRELKHNSAYLGYRICQTAVGQGIATQAVQHIKSIAKSMGLKQLKAIVMASNIASKKVLINNGFEYSHTEQDVLLFDNKRSDLIHFYKTL